MDLPSNTFIALIFFAKEESPVALDLVIITVLFSNLLAEDLRPVFFFVTGIYQN